MAQLSAATQTLVLALCGASPQRVREALAAGGDPHAVVTHESMPAAMRTQEEESYNEHGWWIKSGESKTLFELVVGRPGTYTMDDAEDARRVACARLLVEHGGVIDAATASRCLLTACTIGRSPAIVRWLLEEGGADVNSRRASDGATPLHLTYRTDVLRVLLEAGANVQTRNAYGRTPAHRCAIITPDDDFAASMTALVEAGADLNARNGDGNTVLHELLWPDKSLCVASVLTLLELGADPTLRSYEGATPLDVLLDVTADGCEQWHNMDEEERPSLASLSNAINVLAPVTAWHRRRHLLLAIRGRAA